MFRCQKVKKTLNRNLIVVPNPLKNMIKVEDDVDLGGSMNKYYSMTVNELNEINLGSIEQR